MNKTLKPLEKELTEQRIMREVGRRYEEETKKLSKELLELSERPEVSNKMKEGIAKSIKEYDEQLFVIKSLLNISLSGSYEDYEEDKFLKAIPDEEFNEIVRDMMDKKIERIFENMKGI